MLHCTPPVIYVAAGLSLSIGSKVVRQDGNMAQDEDRSKQITGGEGGSTGESTKSLSAGDDKVLGWPQWTAYAAVIWSLLYAVLGLYWEASGKGFPYSPALVDSATGPLATMFGPAIAWMIVIGAGLPAVALGILMLRGVKRPRLLIIFAGAGLAAVLLLFTTDLTLLVSLAYIPYVIVALVRGSAFGQAFMQGLMQSGWIMGHQLVCLAGGFLWLAATVSYARRSSEACMYCGRREGQEGWTSPSKAARWGRIAVYIAMIPPIVYAFTRYAWALGIPLGMTAEHLKQGQQSGMWVSGLFLANVGLLGAVLMLGLVQRWGEVFPRWVPGLGGRRVPMALAVVPASIMSVLFLVGGINILSAYSQMANAAVATGDNIWVMVSPTFLFTIWGAALALGTLGYYYRQRGPCGKCGRGE